MFARFVRSAGPIATAIFCAVILSACGGEAPLDDDAFLAEVREIAEEAPVAPMGINPSLSANSDGYPRLEIDSDHIVMGVIPHDRITEKRVKLYNRGKGVLNIRRVATNCSCTKGRVEVTDIPPGESIDLIISVDPSLIHAFEATRLLSIESNDPAQSIFPISVESYVDPEFVLQPAGRDLGAIQSGVGFEKTYRIVQQTDDALDILGATVSTPIVQAKVTDVPSDEWTSPDRREFEMTLSVSRDAPLGQLAPRVYFDTNLRRTRQVYLNFVGAIHAQPFTATPTATRLEGIEPGKLFDSVFEIYARNPIESIDARAIQGEGQLVATIAEDGKSASIGVLVGDDGGGATQYTWIANPVIGGQTFEVKLAAALESAGDTE